MNLPAVYYSAELDVIVLVLSKYGILCANRDVYKNSAWMDLETFVRGNFEYIGEF